jgi:PQQ-dependent catabolism-associated CXXCW motif protein
MSGALQTVTMALVALAATVLASAANAESRPHLPEPDGLWSGPMRGPTPTTLNGAVVIDLAGLEALLPEQPVLLDVGPADQRPQGFPNDRLWLPTHRSIPGAVWLPGAGQAALDAGREQAFYGRIEELTQGDRSRPIVTFCLPQCWGSWNAGKRLVMEGYTGVHWFPAGIEGWQRMHDAVEVAPDAAWGTGPGVAP